MKKLGKKSNLVQETLEAYAACNCSYPCIACSCTSTSAPNATMVQVNKIQTEMDFLLIRSL
ncbi:CLI_3235 family bacteriocin precursor [Paenibacillus sp. TH7-28]